MEYNYLGKTNIEVSKICFGALTIGPLQANLSLKKGAEIIAHAFENGINFIDTAELYQTYDYIKEALQLTKKDVVIATKSYAYTAAMMEKSLEKARKELDRDVIDIFLLHEQESFLTIRGHWEAVEYLLKAKDRGQVRAIGISTHNIKGVEGALNIPELEIIHPIVNFRGIGILDGDIKKMLNLLQECKARGKGIYGMKPIGGGNLLKHIDEALTWAFARQELDAVAIGMQSIEEVNLNIARLCGQEPAPQDLAKIKIKQRILHIEDYCEGCGNCIEKCSHKALKLVQGKAKVDVNRCVLCGYCGAVCPHFAIKII